LSGTLPLTPILTGFFGKSLPDGLKRELDVTLSGESPEAETGR